MSYPDPDDEYWKGYQDALDDALFAFHDNKMPKWFDETKEVFGLERPDTSPYESPEAQPNPPCPRCGSTFPFRYEGCYRLDCYYGESSGTPKTTQNELSK